MPPNQGDIDSLPRRSFQRPIGRPGCSCRSAVMYMTLRDRTRLGHTTKDLKCGQTDLCLPSLTFAPSRTNVPRVPSGMGRVYIHQGTWHRYVDIHGGKTPCMRLKGPRPVNPSPHFPPVTPAHRLTSEYVCVSLMPGMESIVPEKGPYDCTETAFLAGL